MLSSEQTYASDMTVKKARSTGLGTLGGYAGTGKTTILRHLYETLRGWGFVAYTGKAASNLRKKGVAAKTIHSTIYRARETPTGTVWELREPKELDHVSGFAIDEASMVGRSLFRDLGSFNKPIIAVGDHGQLPPVDDEAGLMLHPDFRLETIHRNAGPIAEFAQWLREGEDVCEWNSNDSRVRIIGPGELSMAQMLQTDQMIAAWNDERRTINGKVRTALGRVGEPIPGDKMIVLKNYQQFGVYNGQQGVVASMFADYMTLDTGHTFKYRMDDTKFGVPVDYAYCITCHKAQGDEWDSVIVIEPRTCDLWPHSKWTYTAASRAKVSLTWVRRL